MHITYDYLRPNKAELLKQRYELFRINSHEKVGKMEIATSAIVTPAIMQSGAELSCGVLDCNRHYIHIPYSEREDVTELEARFGGTECEFRDETVVYVGFFNEHWGHFITDCLSTFWWLGDIEADKYVFSFYEGKSPKIHANIREALELLGVWDKVEILTTPVKYARVYVPCKGIVPRDYCLPQSKRVYDTIIAEAEKKVGSSLVSYPAKLLMGRARLPKARLNDIGTSEIEDFFIANGYEPVYPENISFSELIIRLKYAEVTVAISGTLMHNMLFAPDGSRLVVIEKYANINNYQQGIDVLKDLDVTYIDAFYLIQSVDPGLGPFILGNTAQMKQFALDNNMCNPMVCIDKAKAIYKYFRLLSRHYKRQWILPEWLEPEIRLLREAYVVSEQEFEPWLTGCKAASLSDYLNIRFLAKSILHRLKR